MATDKKHIAVYLDPAVEQALIAFCEQKGLKSKKGFMYSAGVNAVLAEFFGISDSNLDNIPLDTGNIPSGVSNIPPDTGNIPSGVSNIPPDTGNIPSGVSNILDKTDNILATLASNIPVQSIGLEALPGKQQA
jgi:hypothetical protein